MESGHLTCLGENCFCNAHIGSTDRSGISTVSALTHITRIRRDFDAANSPRYRDDNTLPHIARFRGEFQETLCKSREAFIARRRLLATDKNRHFLVFDKIYLPFVVSMSIHSTK